jgi:hypothetical protein
VNRSLLAEELAPLSAQIEQVGKKREALEGELRAVEAELETFSAARQRIDALREACNALDRLGELKAAELFWEGLPGGEDPAGHLERVRGRIAGFEEEINGILEKQASLEAQINQCLDELFSLDEEVREAHDREERRQEELTIEREMSPVPYRAMLLPWTKEGESERYFRRAVFVALLISFLFGALIHLVKVPIPDRSAAVVQIPERLAKLVKPELPKPPPKPKPVPKQAQEEAVPPEQQKPEKPPKGGAPAPEPAKVAGGGGEEVSAARKKAEHVGVLAFRNAFADLMNETPVARLGTEARLTNNSPRAAGQAVAQRSLVAMQAEGGSSGGIGNAVISRNVGSGGGGGFGIGSGFGSGKGPGFARVESSIGGAGGGPRPLSDGLAAGRTDEEIQIVFDRYKASLYRIYNAELRKDPTLRGKMLLRITIETSGEVSMCKVESTDLASPELVANILERIKRFNFGPKEGVGRLTILYPIDFLPAA